MLIMPFPSPEEKYPQRIVIADITKEMEIILSAGMPSSSISELAENNCSNCPGKHQNITVPRKAMIAPVGSRKSFQHFLNAQSVYQVVKEPGPVKQDNQESMETKEYIFPIRGSGSCRSYKRNNHKMDADGMEHQKSEGYTTLKEAEKRKKEIEYKQSLGTFVVPKCTKVKELIKEYVRIYGHNEWGVATYDGNIGLINNYIIPTIGEVQLSEINNHFMEKYYTDLLKMPAVKSSRNPDGDKLITAATVHQIHKVLRSCFRR